MIEKQYEHVVVVHIGEDLFLGLETLGNEKGVRELALARRFAERSDAKTAAAALGLEGAHVRTVRKAFFRIKMRRSPLVHYFYQGGASNVSKVCSRFDSRYEAVLTLAKAHPMWSNDGRIVRVKEALCKKR
jgi:hypothetical protein